MKLGLDGKVVLVTGGSKGIGLACARAFLDEGARVGLVSRAQAHLDHALAELGAGGTASRATPPTSSTPPRRSPPSMPWRARSARSTCWSTAPARRGASRPTT